MTDSTLKLLQEFKERWEGGNAYTNLQPISSVAMQAMLSDIASIADQIQTATRNEVDEWVKSWGAIPETDEYANGWNDCRKELAEGYKRHKVALLALKQQECILDCFCHGPEGTYGQPALDCCEHCCPNWKDHRAYKRYVKQQKI